MTWLFGKRNPQEDLENLTAALQTALGKNLKSVIVFGSHARGEYDEKRSNLNVLVVSDLSYESLERMGAAVKSWLRRGHVPPVLVSPDDLDDFARDFPVEFLDMKDHHQVLWGKDVLARLHVDKAHLESQVEHDLALVQLRLRQMLSSAGGSGRDVRRGLEKASSSISVLLQAAQRLESKKGPGLDRMQAAVEQARKIRSNLKKSIVQDAAKRYLTVIETVLTHLRKR